MWTCSECGKSFRTNNQWHSCYMLNVDDHLQNKDSNVRDIVNELIKRLDEFGQITINPVKSSIQVKAGATFLSIKAKKAHVELEFQSGYEINEFPVHKSIRISKHRFLHFIHLDSPGDIDEQLEKWLSDSCKLVKNGR